MFLFYHLNQPKILFYLPHQFLQIPGIAPLPYTVLVPDADAYGHRRSVKNKTGGAKACKIKLGGQRRKKVI